MFEIYSWLLDRWFSVFIKYLCYVIVYCVIYVGYIYTFNKLSGPKTSLFVFWYLAQVLQY